MSSDPTKAAKDYLNKNGYPFEMKTASLFQKADIGIYQSTYYIDPTTQKPREIDIVGIFIKKFQNKHFNIVFPIECKYAVSPWILFSSLTEGFSNCYTYNKNGGRWMQHLLKQQDWAKLFELERNLGYGLTIVNSTKNTDEQSNAQAKKDTKDTPHEAIQTLLNFLKSENEYHRFAHPNDFVIYVPIIAIRGALVEARLGQDGLVECREITEGQIYYKEDLSGVIPKIHVVAESKLEGYIEKLKADCEKLTSAPYITESVIQSASSQPTSGRNAPSKNSY